MRAYLYARLIKSGAHYAHTHYSMTENHIWLIDLFLLKVRIYKIFLLNYKHVSHKNKNKIFRLIAV